MASGYIRQAAANISAGLGIHAADHNAEYNQIQSAFDNSTGHDHSGSSSGVGAKIILTSAVTGILPLANGGTATNATTGTGLINSLLALSGSNRLAALNGLDVTGSVTISTTLGVTGTITASGALTIGTTLGVTGTSTLGVVNSGNHGITGTLTVSSATTLTGLLTANGGIKGTTTNDNATAGNYGEYGTNNNIGSPAGLTDNVALALCGLPLAAGDWDVSGDILFVSSAGMTETTVDVFATSTAFSSNAIQLVNGTGVGGTIHLPTTTTRFSLSGSTTINLVCRSRFSSGSVTASGTIRARRIR